MTHADPIARARAAVQALYDADPASQALGIAVLEVAPGRVRVDMTVRPDMANGHGICHGGLVFSLADSAFAFACNSQGEAMVAAAASIEFLAPARVGERLVATASETSRVGRQGVYDVIIQTAAGSIIALFRGRCARLPERGRQHPREGDPR
jgi:acyl-CoA thioesterase